MRQRTRTVLRRESANWKIRRICVRGGAEKIACASPRVVGRLLRIVGSAAKSSDTVKSLALEGLYSTALSVTCRLSRSLRTISAGSVAESRTAMHEEPAARYLPVWREDSSV